MILYFSGTGNSEYVATRIGKQINDEVVNLFEKIRNKDFSDLYSRRPWVIVTPTYAWRIPRMVENWMKKTAFTGSRQIYFVMTCGENIGNAGHYLKKLCAGKKLDYMGCKAVVMPENYIALFSTPTQEAAMQIIDRAKSEIDALRPVLESEKPLSQTSPSLLDILSSGIVNDLFYPVFVHAKKFYTIDACVSCAKCREVCPLNNIQLKNGKPVWGDHCTHCMACICRCPKEAIEYGKHSRGLPRYVCKKKD